MQLWLNHLQLTPYNPMSDACVFRQERNLPVVLISLRGARPALARFVV
jgi:hypothetical protein